MRRTEEEIEQGLIALAVYNGDATAASEALAEGGFEVSPQALTHSKNRRNKRYFELRNMRLAVVRDRMGEAAGRLADRRATMLGEVLDRLEGRIAEMDIKDLVTLMRALDQGYASSMQISEKLTDQPAIVEVRKVDLTIERLQRLGVLEVVDSTATEIEAEVA